MTALVVVTAPAVEPLTVAEVMRHCRIDQANQELAPQSFTVALASPAAAGNVNAGAHRYLATFVTADGETEAGIPSESVTVANAAVNGQVSLTGIPIGGALVTSRKLYRTAAGGSTYLLLATIADNTTTIYTDNIADASLGAGAPSTNTTSDPGLLALIKAARASAEKMTRRALITQTLDYKLDHFPCWELWLPKPTLQSVTSITYVDVDGATQTLASDQYRVDADSAPGRITPAYGLTWPVTRTVTGAVTVRYVAGYGVASAVPDSIKHWMLLRIKHFYDNPGTMAAGMTEFPRSFIDGLLDDHAVPGFEWAE